MPSKPEWQIIAESIIKNHDGKMYFNLTEVRKITGIGENRISRKLVDAGILVKKEKRTKRISAYDIATLMTTGRVSAID